MDDHGKDESARTKDLINLTAHMLDLLPARVRKPCADMLLMWESDKGDFLVFVVFFVQSCDSDEVSFVNALETDTVN